MALSGSLREFALSEILQLLSSQRKTGSLRLTRGTETSVIYLLEGRVAAVRDRGMPADDPMARFLRRIHRLSDEQMRGVASIHHESGRDLVDLLLNGRYIEREELSMLYERMVLDVLHDVLVWDDGIYSFSNVTPPESVLPVSLSTESMLMEAVRRTDEMRRYQTKLTDKGLVLGLRELPDPDAALSEEEKELFGLVDGRRTLGELLAEAPLTDYEAYEALYRLVDAGWIELQGRRAPEEPAPVDLNAARRALGASWRIDLALAGSCMAVVLVFQVLAWKTSPAVALAAPATAATDDPYAALALRDVRFALDMHRTQKGRYPGSLDALVEAGWLQRRQQAYGRYAYAYAPALDGGSYTLEFTKR
ncbi:MAG: DUF4388 domain-containing protein [Candidatus Eisenbacteria bacterium]